MNESKTNALLDSNDWVERLVHLAALVSAFERADPQAAATSPEFLQRCNTASAAALDIARLRRQRELLGFLPLPLWEYIGELAQAAGVDLQAIRVIAGREPTGLGIPRNLARLCRQIGFSFREALLHLRLDFTERAGASPPMLMARRPAEAGRNDALAANEESLREALAACGTSDYLRALENELRSAYEETSVER